MSDPFHDQTEEELVLNIPLEGRGSNVELEATIALDGDTKEDVEELLESYEPRPLAHKDRIKKELVDGIQKHITVQVEEK